MRRFFLVLAMLVAVSATSIVQQVSAQTGSVTGLVRSADTGSPLIAAVVQVLTEDGGRVASSLTNQSGRYSVSNVPPGTYVVTVYNTGYDNGRQTGVVVSAGQPATANFDLATRAIDLDPIVVSASRREERALDAPARVEVVTPEMIEELPAVQPTEHLRGVAGVDIVTQGIQSTNVVARGFNNVFSGSLLALTDHRIAAIPSLRVNALYMVPATNEDIERMEIVLGPGSALYGPNTANGVLHMLTRSPLTYQGSTIALTGGERGVFQGSARTAQLLGENVGVKLSGQYFQANEWEYTDPIEAQARQAALAANPGTRIGLRDFDTERYSVDGRVDWRITPGATGILSAGRTSTLSGVELTGVGAAQINDWSYDYVQARFNTGGLFAQAYMNASNAGETYTLRDGQAIVDESKFYVAQIQHAVTPMAWQSFTYGADYLRTNPQTGGTIHGRYEDEDDFTEIGAFIQSETTPGRQLDLVLAGRLDRHSVVDATVFSPRAALVFKPSEGHSLRASYNRAYSNPGSVQLFLDINAGPVPGQLGNLGYGLRALGTGTDGFSFQNASGEYSFRTPFIGSGTQLNTVNNANLWQAQLQAFAAVAVSTGQLTPALAQQLVQFLGPQVPSADIYGIDPVTQAAAPFSGMDDIPGIRESNTTTYEVGYKGLLGDNLLLAADVWYSQRDNFISALIPQTNFVLLNPAQVIAHTQPRVQAALQAQGYPAAQAQALAAAAAQGIAQIPAGVVASPDITTGADLLVTYRNFGDIDLWGGDIAATALFGDFTVGVSASLVSDDNFETEGQIITLNAPEQKGSASLGYRNQDLGFNAEGRVRYSSGFPVNSGVFVGLNCIVPTNTTGCVESYTLADFTAGYQIGQIPGATIQLTVQNIFDTQYQSFIGVPEVGRLALVRLKYDF